MKKTTKVYTEFNQLLLSQYKDKPAMKAEYYSTYGKLYKDFFKEYWERITRVSENLRGEILMLENPSKIPLFNILLDLVSDNITLLKKEKNQYVEYQKDMSIELLRWLKTRLPKENLAIKKDVRSYYFRELKAYFNPQAQFKNFIYNKEFTTIDFTGTQAQLAGIFIQINSNNDLIKSNWKNVAIYIFNNFTAKGKETNRNTIESYLTGKKTISKKNEIEIKI